MATSQAVAPRVHPVQLREQDMHDVSPLLRQLTARFDSVEDTAFLADAVTYAQELPRSLRSALNRFRLTEPTGLCLITGFPVDDDKLGPTPAHWRSKPVPSPTLEADIFFFLCSSLLGDPIGWSTQQQGYILHDILPIKGHETEQLGSGSEVLLTWHTEDAFHPYRTDYLGLMCLRNPDNVETTVATLDDVHLAPEEVDILFEPRFVIRPDESHLTKNRTGLWRDFGVSDELLQRSAARIDRMNAHPEKLAVLFGDRASPYMRLDPYFMDRCTDDPQAMQAFDRFVSLIDESITGIALQPGDMLFIDNYRVVHGRKPFRARFDGTDRWLRRLNVARDLRKSRDARPQADCRVIF